MDWESDWYCQEQWTGNDTGTVRNDGLGMELLL